MSTRVTKSPAAYGVTDPLAAHTDEYTEWTATDMTVYGAAVQHDHRSAEICMPWRPLGGKTGH